MVYLIIITAQGEVKQRQIAISKILFHMINPILRSARFPVSYYISTLGAIFRLLIVSCRVHKPNNKENDQDGDVLWDCDITEGALPDGIKNKMDCVPPEGMDKARDPFS